MNILILCTGNSCRSQIAHGFLQSLDNRIRVFSAGTDPSDKVHEKAIEVMKEVGIDISRHKPEPVELWLDEAWDYVITVCDEAHETCPVFTGNVGHRLHAGFEDPSKVIGSESVIINEFRSVRDEIMDVFNRLYIDKLKPMLNEKG